MATKVLLVDPDIDFAVGIKRALEQTSGYRVTAFVNGQAAIELVRAEPQDLAILDFEPGDMDIAALIIGLRAIQPGLFILVSPRTDVQAARLSTLNVQGSITKPYLARQLIPVIREALAARARQPKPPRTATPPAPLPAAPEPPPVSPDFDAALAVLTPTNVEPPIQPDDTFRQQIAALQGDKPATPAGLRKTLENFTVPPAADNATLGELVDVPPQPTPNTDTLVLFPPEPPASEPSFVAALAAQPTLSLPAVEPEPAAIEVTEPESVKEEAAPPAPAETPEMDSESAQTIVDEAEVPVSDPAAEAAARLTHTAIGSAVRATILTRAGVLVASVGDLNSHAVAGVVEVIVQVWQTTDDEADPENAVPRLRYIQVPGVGDFMLYSTRTVSELCLSMLFPAEMPIRLIRQQARKLIDSLERDQLPGQATDLEAFSEPEAAQTLPSRPTKPRPPDELRAAIDAANTPANPAADVTYTPYTLLWLPRAESLAPDVSAHLSDWIEAAANARAWRVQDSAASAGCVTIRIDLPADQLPGTAIDTLQRATAERAAQADLWDDAYYVIASDRAVTPQEIEQFVAFGRSNLTPSLPRPTS